MSTLMPAPRHSELKIGHWVNPRDAQPRPAPPRSRPRFEAVGTSTHEQHVDIGGSCALDAIVGQAIVARDIELKLKVSPRLGGDLLNMGRRRGRQAVRYVLGPAGLFPAISRGQELGRSEIVIARIGVHLALAQFGQRPGLDRFGCRVCAV